jgi:hypothetical protein
MFTCDRCGDEVLKLWSTVEMFSRLGNYRNVDLCQTCTMIAYSFVLNRPLAKEDGMTIVWEVPLNDPEDIDDGEHASMCMCHECDPDFWMEYRRDIRDSA